MISEIYWFFLCSLFVYVSQTSLEKMVIFLFVNCPKNKLTKIVSRVFGEVRRFYLARKSKLIFKIQLLLVALIKDLLKDFNSIFKFLKKTSINLMKIVYDELLKSLPLIKQKSN